MTLNFLLTPMVVWFQKLPMRRVPAVALVMLISIAAVGGMGWVVANQLLEVANDFPKYRLNIRNKIEALHARPNSSFGRATQSVEEIGNEISSSESSPANPPAIYRDAALGPDRLAASGPCRSSRYYRRVACKT